MTNGRMHACSRGSETHPKAEAEQLGAQKTKTRSCSPSFHCKRRYFHGVKNPHEPSLEQGGLGRPQLMPSGPRVPLVLQKARTAHLTSKLTRFTSGFLYSFFLFFSKVFPYEYSV
jgi:hypothetical protein